MHLLKNLHGGRRGAKRGTPRLQLHNSAKSIAPCRMQSPKNLHGGLRGATRGWRLKYKSCTRSVGLPRRITRCIPLHALRYTLRKISCTLQIARAEKLLKNLRGGLRCATRGWCTKSPLKVRLRCKACHAEERAAFRICSTAKSTAPCRMHSPKNLHGELRCAKRGRHLKPAPRIQLRICSSAKSIAPCRMHL